MNLLLFNGEQQFRIEVESWTNFNQIRLKVTHSFLLQSKYFTLSVDAIRGLLFNGINERDQNEMTEIQIIVSLLLVITRKNYHFRWNEHNEDKEYEKFSNKNGKKMFLSKWSFLELLIQSDKLLMPILSECDQFPVDSFSSSDLVGNVIKKFPLSILV